MSIIPVHMGRVQAFVNELREDIQTKRSQGIMH